MDGGYERWEGREGESVGEEECECECEDKWMGYHRRDGFGRVGVLWK